MINVSTAAKIFEKNPRLSKWIPTHQNVKNAMIKYVKDGENIQKVVTRNDGTEIVATFNNGKVVNAELENVRGKIKTDFAPDNKNLPEAYQTNKTVTVTNSDGDKFTRVYKKDGKISDIWITDRAPVKTGKFDGLFKEYLNKILTGKN